MEYGRGCGWEQRSALRPLALLAISTMHAKVCQCGSGLWMSLQLRPSLQMCDSS